jgi:hypothetical protein
MKLPLNWRQALMVIPILGLVGCYGPDEVGPINYMPLTNTYSAWLNTILEFDSTSAVLQATARVAGSYQFSDSGWSVTLNSSPLTFNSSNESYSSNAITPVVNSALNWSVSQGSRSNLAELSVRDQNPSIPTKIIFPNDTTVVAIDSPIVLQWVPDSTRQFIHVDVFDSAGNATYEWFLPNNGLDTLLTVYGPHPLVAGPATLRMWRDNNFNGYTQQFNYQVDAESRITAHFVLK